ncbi:MAG: hypothetical protein R8P61_16390 [Bacteroidia bacterium]|nr:hypothetical protein [Bacteroidia bacterium]
MLLRLLAFVLLTILTQLGGLIYILFIGFRPYFKKHFPERSKRILAKIAGFTLFYLCISFILLPLLAKPFGRVPLPLSGNLKPLNYFTAILNRHYVSPELKDLLQDSADKMQAKYPGTVIAYMDANLAFLKGFPLVPHLSHSDGKKADIAFLYKDAESGDALHRTARNFMGYGGSDLPRKGEIDKAADCVKQGYWQYDLMSRFMPSTSEEKMILDEIRMKAYVRILVNDSRAGKILLEPHLKQRLGLNYNKVRFHGCRAVRHDDHLHVQL